VPKLKTHKGAAKRFRVTRRGKLLRRQSGLRHLLSSKRRKRKRQLSRGALVSGAEKVHVQRLLPYAG